MLQFGNISFDPVFWFCASGKSFFLGLLLLIILVTIPIRNIKNWKRYVLHFIRICALLLVLLSSTPIHPLFYVIGLFLLVAASIKSTKQIYFRILFVLFALSMIVLEIPFHILPSISTDGVNCIYVIGDSVSAGMGTKEEQTWPILFEKQTGIKTINLAKAGATAESALKQAIHISDENSIVIVEIGGNDLLGHTPLESFKTSCDELLGKLSSCKRIIWLELPSLPQYYPYGRIQRKLAHSHDIILAPKSVLTDVFSTEGATSDGIHLTKKGHEVMASEVLYLFKNHKGCCNEDKLK